MVHPLAPERFPKFLSSKKTIKSGTILKLLENAKDRYGENVMKKSRHIMKEIVEMEASDRDSKEKLYKKIVIFTIVSSGMGNPTLHSVLREAQGIQPFASAHFPSAALFSAKFLHVPAALHSIFRPSELDNFLMQPSAVKEEQLMEFARITNGIRLFNKDCQKGGDGIDDRKIGLEFKN